MATTTETRKRAAGRPRVYSDETIFAAVDEVLRIEGYVALTLEAIALRVGCTRQALVRRFGSKETLLLSFLDAIVAMESAQLSHMGRTADSPLAALYDRFALLPENQSGMSADPRGQAELMAFLLTASGDAEFAARIAALNRMTIQAVAWLLQSAIDRGELAPIDTQLVARILYNLLLGAIADWCVDPATDVPATLTRGFDLIIGPYRLPPR